MFLNLFRIPFFLSPNDGGGVAPEQAAAPEQETAAQTDAPAAPEAANEAAPAAEGQPVPKYLADGHRHSLTGGMTHAAPAAQKQPDAVPPESDAERAPNKQPEEDSKEALRERVAQMQVKLGEYQLRTAAALAGVPKERIPYAMRMADVEGLDPSAPDAAAGYTAAIAKVLEAVPELRGSAGVGTGSVGNFPRKSPDALDPDIAKITKNILG